MPWIITGKDNNVMFLIGIERKSPNPFRKHVREDFSVVSGLGPFSASECKTIPQMARFRLDKVRSFQSRLTPIKQVPTSC